MDLLFLRHGIAEDWGPGGDDRLRALTDEGCDKCRQAAVGLARLGLRFSHVWSSPLVRALQTAELVLPNQPYELRAELAGGTVEMLLVALRELPADAVVLLVGHEPQLSLTVEALLGAQYGAVTMKKAGLAHVQVDLRHGPEAQGSLVCLLTPAQLRALGGA
jgi:phosphohistidine phosphatase